MEAIRLTEPEQYASVRAPARVLAAIPSTLPDRAALAWALVAALGRERVWEREPEWELARWEDALLHAPGFLLGGSDEEREVTRETILAELVSVLNERDRAVVKIDAATVDLVACWKRANPAFDRHVVVEAARPSAEPANDEPWLVATLSGDPVAPPHPALAPPTRSWYDAIAGASRLDPAARDLSLAGADVELERFGSAFASRHPRESGEARVERAFAREVLDAWINGLHALTGRATSSGEARERLAGRSGPLARAARGEVE